MKPSLRIILVLLTILLTLPGPLAAAAPEPQQRAARLAEMRRQIAALGYTFQVGDNPALDIPLEILCGELPADDKFLDHVYVEPRDPALNLPDRFDWRDHGGVTAIRNQSFCGGCWAFAAVGTLECNILIKDGVEVDLAEQMSIDCDKGGLMGSYGCNGGWTYKHLFYLKQTGATMERWYPYMAKDLPCDSTGLSKPYKVADYGAVDNTPADIKQAIYTHGPVSCSVAVDDLFQAYTGGIYNGPGASSTNHAVILVGWDENDGQGYWIMKNSWGPGWGEDGFMRIRYGAALIGSNPRWVEYTSLAVPNLYQTGVIIGSGEELTPGQRHDIFVDVTNSGAAATGVSVTLATDDPYVTVVEPTCTYPDLAPGAKAAAAQPFVVELSPDMPLGTLVQFSLEFNTSEKTMTTGRFASRVQRPDVLVLDLDGNHNSGPAIAQALADNGITATVQTRYDDLRDLDKYNGVFVCLGVMGQSVTPPSVDAYYLRRRLAVGKNLYVEGGNIWSNFSPGLYFRSWFNIDFTDAGGSDLSTILGADNSRWAGLSLDYSGDNEGIDRLAPRAGADVVFTNALPAYGCGIANSAYDYYGNGQPFVFRALGVSFEFGGLTDVEAPNDRATLMNGIINFLQIPVRGDIDGDSRVTAADAPRLHQVLAENEPLVAYAGADVNDDGRIDVLDVLTILSFFPLF